MILRGVTVLPEAIPRLTDRTENAASPRMLTQFWHSLGISCTVLGYLYGTQARLQAQFRAGPNGPPGKRFFCTATRCSCTMQLICSSKAQGLASPLQAKSHSFPGLREAISLARTSMVAMINSHNIYFCINTVKSLSLKDRHDNDANLGC